jgi:hypothetical protein
MTMFAIMTFRARGLATAGRAVTTVGVAPAR